MIKLGVTPEQLAHDMTMLQLNKNYDKFKTMIDLYSSYMNEYDKHITYIKGSLLNESVQS
ncbi:hypothetical protein J6TS7_56290 [Paenibacillus dendritiformis]|nr:hypothetical protein J6TS7_56290 [Paenibacillus dendritiformis]